MSEPYQSEDVTAYNESSLQELAWAIEVSVGQFKLLLARCKYTSLRPRLVERLREMTSVDISILELKESEKTLFARIKVELEEEQPDALMIFGLETVDNLDHLLITTNQVREEFRKNFYFPLILWVNDEVMKKLLQLAPDFESWAITTNFAITTDELIDFLRITADQVFDNNFTFTLEACREIKLACYDLQNRLKGLDVELKASIESLLGFTEYADLVNRNIDTSLAHYQRALKLWQQTNNLDRQGQILSDIAFCYYLKALPSRTIDHPNWQATKHYIKQSFAVFEQAQRLDLVADSIVRFGKILRLLQDWEQLQSLAQKALQLHQIENKPIKLAQDYGFLAEVALANKSWEEAKELAQRALKVLSTVSSLEIPSISGVVSRLPDDKSIISDAPSLYRLLLARSQQHLGQYQEAIRNLEVAREVGSPEYDTELYIHILKYLQQLYFEQKKYLEAFEVKLDQKSIEQQYGFRAFVGAGRIEPQRLGTLALMQVKGQETVALEITASGRLLDVERLIERIGRNDCKLIVIHGQSGVGKSSLVSGGLVPALKQRAIGTGDVLPVAIRIYTNWIAQLECFLAKVLLDRGIELTTPLNSQVAILDQIQRIASLNLRIVLIFDQFEEFFIYTDLIKRRQFFEFLGDCLNILPVKVILSLREDYLHYLLECNRFSSMAIISNDILSKNVLYPLGNFSPTDTCSIIQQLTEHSNFYLEPALIEKLVQDLAGDLNEVRPIELQVVGAQLQTESITTLAKYQQLGIKAKEELVRRYLAEVVEDCGAENEQLAKLVLYLLTDEKGTRPLKTKADLAANLITEVNQLDLVLKIFVKSGLVLLLPETPAERYQLVHDYLVTFIHQQQNSELVVKLKEAQEQGKLSEQKLNRFLKSAFPISVAVIFILVILTVSAVKSTGQAQRLLEGQINALIQSSKTFASSDQAFDALLSAMRAGQPLFKEQLHIKPESRRQVVSALQEAVYQVREYNRLEGHIAPLTSVSFSPNSQTIATASADKTAKLWSLDGKKLQTLRGHNSWVNSVSFSPDGKTVVTASADKTAKLWSLEGKELQTLRGHNSWVNSVSFSPDGKTIATASSDKTAKLWSLEGKELQTLKGHDGGVYSVSFSPDGKTIATASADKTVKLWSLEGKELQTLKGHKIRVNSVSFSPDGKTIVTASADKTAKLWSLEGKELQTLKGHDDGVYSVSFSPDGKTIATASADKTAKLWSLEGKELQTLKGHKIRVNNVSFSPDGKTIATASSDKTAKLWSLNGSKAIKIVKGHKKFIWDVSFSPDGKTIATASDDNTAKLWSLDGKELQTLKGHSQRVNSVSFSPDGKTIATASWDKTVKLWSLDGKEFQTLKGHSERVNSVSFSPNGRTIATASKDKTVKLWSLDGKELQTLKGHDGVVWDVSFSPDGKTIATASFDNSAKLWSLDGKVLRTLRGHSSWVSSVSFSPDGKTIATASFDNSAKLWSLDGKELQTLRGHSDPVMSVSFSPQGNTIATVSRDKTGKLWSFDAQELQTLRGHNDRIYSVSFSPQGNIIATASQDKTVILWNLSLTLDHLEMIACDWAGHYLKYNLKLEEEDHHLCDFLDGNSFQS